MAEQKITYNRAKLWQIGGFAMNNAATNLYLFATQKRNKKRR